MGTLALVGSGEYLPPMLPVDRALLDRVPGTPRVVCIATAAAPDGPETFARWGQMGVEQFGERLGAAVEAVPLATREDAHDASIVEAIRAANFVYFSGGKPTYLYDTLAGTPAWEAVRGVLDAGGVVAGCSAGAMIMGRRATPFPQHRGFGLLPDAVIMPHYDELPPAMAGAVKWIFVPVRVLLGVEGNTAFVANGGHTYEVLGTGGVTVWGRGVRQRYAEGESVHLP